MSAHLITVNNLLNGIELREGEPIRIGISEALGPNVEAYYIGTEFITIALFIPGEEPNSRWKWVIANTQSCWVYAQALKDPITKIFESILKI